MALNEILGYFIFSKLWRVLVCYKGHSFVVVSSVHCYKSVTQSQGHFTLWHPVLLAVILSNQWNWYLCHNVDISLIVAANLEPQLPMSHFLGLTALVALHELITPATVLLSKVIISSI